MSELSRCVGGGYTFTHKDKTYEVSLITQKIKVAFEKLIFARARESVRLSKEDMTRAEFVEALRDKGEEYTIGTYALEGRLGTACASGTKGGIILGSLLFGVSEEEMLLLMGERREEIAELMVQVGKDSFPGLTPVDEDEAPAEAPVEEAPKEN